MGVVRTAPGGRVGVSVGGGGGDGEGLRWPVCGHMERVLRLLLRLCLRSLRLLVLLLLLLLLGRIRIHGPARARARRRRRVHTTRRHRRHRGCVRVCRSKRERRTGSLESDALHRETSVSGLLRTESIDIARVRAAPRPRPRCGGARVDRRGRRAGGVERAGAECLVGGVAVRVGCIVVLSWRACWVVPLLLLLVWAVRAASVARRRRLRLHFVFVFARGVFFLPLDYLRSCTIPTCGGGEDEIGEQSRKGEEEERKSKVAVEMDGQEGVESSRVSVAPLYSNRLRHRTRIRHGGPL